MSTSPRVCARPSIDSASTGFGQPQELHHRPVRRLDGSASRQEDQDRGALPARRRDATALPRVTGTIPQDALGDSREPLRMIGQRCHAHLAAQAVRPRDLADHHETRAHRGLYFFSGALAIAVVFGAFAISLRTVFDGWAPFLIHASTFARSIDTVGGWVSGL